MKKLVNIIEDVINNLESHNIVVHDREFKIQTYVPNDHQKLLILVVSDPTDSLGQINNVINSFPLIKMNPDDMPKRSVAFCIHDEYVQTVECQYASIKADREEYLIVNITNSKVKVQYATQDDDFIPIRASSTNGW